MAQGFHLSALELFTELKEAQMLDAHAQKLMESALATAVGDEQISVLDLGSHQSSHVERVPALGDLVGSFEKYKGEAACASYRAHKLQEENSGLRSDLARCVRADVPSLVDGGSPETLKLTEKLILDILVHRYLVATDHKDVAALLQEQLDLGQVGACVFFFQSNALSFIVTKIFPFSLINLQSVCFETHATSIAPEIGLRDLLKGSVKVGKGFLHTAFSEQYHSGKIIFVLSNNDPG